MRNTLNRKYLLPGDRRLARALRPRLRRPGVLPPRRPRDAHRRDGVGHVGHGELGPAPSTGGPRSGPRTRSGPRGTSPSATTCTSRSWSSRSTTCSSATRSRRSTPASTRTSASASPLEPAGLGPAHRQVPRRHPRGQPRRAPRVRVAPGHADRRPPQQEGARPSRRSPTSSVARWPSWRWPGAPRTRNVSTVITGASRAEQVHENMKALDVIPPRRRRPPAHRRDHLLLALTTTHPPATGPGPATFAVGRVSSAP